MNKFFNHPWTQRIVSAIAVGIACYIATVTAMKKDIEILQTETQNTTAALQALTSRVKLVESEQAKTIVFRESGERFSQSHGKALELKARDYTDNRIREVVVDLKEDSREIKAALIKLTDKIDEYIQQKG